MKISDLIKKIASVLDGEVEFTFQKSNYYVYIM